MRKQDYSKYSNLADFTIALSFLLPQREENEKKGLFQTLQVSRFYYSSQFLVTTGRGKMRKVELFQILKFSRFY